MKTQNSYLALESLSRGRTGGPWRRVSREDAIRSCAYKPVAVVSTSMGMTTAQWFSEKHAFYRGDGPWNYESSSYFIYTAGEVRMGGGSGSGGGRSASRASVTDSTGEAEAAALEQPQKERAALHTLEWLSTSSKAPITRAAAGEAMFLRARCEGLMPADSVTFTILKADTGEKIEVLAGRVEDAGDGDAAMVRWTAQKDKFTKVVFVARQFQKKLECRSGAITIGPAAVLGGASLHLVSARRERLKDAAAKIHSHGEEVFSGKLPDGILEISDLPPGNILLSVEWKGVPFT